MQRRLQAWLDPHRVSPGEELSAMVPPGDLERLDGLAEVVEPGLRVELKFDRAAAGRLRITGHLSGDLRVVCQRCLDPMTWTLERDLDVEVVGGDAAAAKVEGEAFELVDGRVMLRELVADEVLLAMPLAPRHEEACTAQAFAG